LTGGRYRLGAPRGVMIRKSERLRGFSHKPRTQKIGWGREPWNRVDFEGERGGEEGYLADLLGESRKGLGLKKLSSFA